MCDPVTIAITGANMYMINEQTKMMARAEDERARIQATQAKFQIAELEQQRRMERIKARQEEQERAKLLDTSLSTITAFGKGVASASIDNIINQNKMAYDLDIGTSRFNLGVYDSSVANQIKVISASQTPSQSGAIRRIGMVRTATAGLTGYQDYQRYNSPGSPSTTTTTTTPRRRSSSYVVTPSNSGYTFGG